MKPREVGGAIRTKKHKCQVFIYLTEGEGVYIDIPRTMALEIVNAGKELSEELVSEGGEPLDMAAHIDGKHLIIGELLDPEDLAEATSETTASDLEGEEDAPEEDGEEELDEGEEDGEEDADEDGEEDADEEEPTPVVVKEKGKKK